MIMLYTISQKIFPDYYVQGISDFDFKDIFIDLLIGNIYFSKAIFNKYETEGD